MWSREVSDLVASSSMCVYGVFPHHQAILRYLLGVLQFISILKLPRDIIRSYNLRAESYKIISFVRYPQLPQKHFRYQSRLSTCAPGPIGYRLGVQANSSSGSIHLLEWLTELKRNILLTTLPVYYKTQEQPDGRDEQCKVWGEGCKAFRP